MPEPLKNLLHAALVGDMADRIAANAPAFDEERFMRLATDGLDSLELMERSALIRDALFATLPDDFIEAAAILKASLPASGRHGLTGWMLLPVNQFIAARGPDHFELGLDLLKALTPHFTAEFGIRPSSIATSSARSRSSPAGSMIPTSMCAGWRARERGRVCPGPCACRSSSRIPRRSCRS